MRKSFRVSAFVGVLAVIVALNALSDPVAPANVQINAVRDEGSSSPISAVVYYQGNTLSLTNSVMYTGDTTNSAVQDLSGCVITVVVGQPGVTNNNTATGYTIVAASGTWGADFTIPDYNPCYIEVTVSNTAVFTYPRYRINTQEQLPTP